MKRTWIVLGALVAVGLTASVATAANVHLKGGGNAKPSFNDGGLFLRASGALAGLGNARATASEVLSSVGLGPPFAAGQMRCCQ